MSAQARRVAAATAFLLTTVAAPVATVGPAAAVAPGHLTAGDANVALDTWGLGPWSEARVLPRRLRWQRSCSTSLAGGDRAVLRVRDDAGIRSRIAVRRDGQAARATARRADRRVAGCQAGRPAADRVVTGWSVRTTEGAARLYGTALGMGRHAVRLEYVVVARSGRAAEVATLRVFAQDTPPEKTLRALARRVVARLHQVG